MSLKAPSGEEAGTEKGQEPAEWEASLQIPFPNWTKQFCFIYFAY